MLSNINDDGVLNPLPTGGLIHHPCSLYFQLVMVFLAVQYVPAYYGAYSYPDWAESIGWALALCPVALIPFTMIVQFFRRAHKPQVLYTIYYNVVVVRCR